MSIYLIEQREEIEWDAWKRTYIWKTIKRATNKELAFDLMNELIPKEPDTRFRIVRLIS